MTPEIERERRANQIVRNADLYGSDQDFRKMVDNTVYLTQDQREHSALVIDSVYGTRNSTFSTIYWHNKFGEGDAA